MIDEILVFFFFFFQVYTCYTISLKAGLPERKVWLKLKKVYFMCEHKPIRFKHMIQLKRLKSVKIRKSGLHSYALMVS